MDRKYLELLSKDFPSIEAVASEMINLSAVRSLPKGTEYFFSDLHGEYEAFLHLLKSASGMIRAKIDKIFGKTITVTERERLAGLIYYPEERIRELKNTNGLTDERKKITIYRLIQVCETVSAKYTRSKVRKKMPEEYRYVMDELLNVTEDVNKEFYYDEIIHMILETGMAEKFIIALCKLIQGLSIDRLHIIGDIFDRGPRADIIMNELIRFGDVDIQWGNHDISWMGAASGNRVLVANVVRIALSYNSFDLLEDGYGINLRPLAVFANEVYKDDLCKQFMPHQLDLNQFDPVDPLLAARMHKAIAIIQFKLEGAMVKKHPEYHMDSRNILERIDYANGTLDIDGKVYLLKDTMFPTIDTEHPLELTAEEKELMDVLVSSFQHSSLLNKHIKFLYANGSMYTVYNNNLLYHGCIPMEEDGSFTKVLLDGKEYAGHELLDKINSLVNQAYFGKQGTKKQEDACDFMWYLWCGAKSPLFGKHCMTTFESYFIEDKKVKTEIYNPYYSLSNNEEICDRILNDFSVDIHHGHIINGHVPVKIKDGESPIKANGKLFVIDGGISKAYQSRTGIAGYTLIYDSHSLLLAEHMPYVAGNQENTPKVSIVEKMSHRVNVSDTDRGKELLEEINDLKKLLDAYRDGSIREKNGKKTK